MDFPWVSKLLFLSHRDRDTFKIVIDEIRKKSSLSPFINMNNSAVIQDIDTGQEDPLRKTQDKKVLFHENTDWFKIFSPNQSKVQGKLIEISENKIQKKSLQSWLITQDGQIAWIQ